MPSTVNSRVTQIALAIVGVVVTILGYVGIHLPANVVAGVDTVVVAAIGWIEALIVHGQHKVAAAQAASPTQTRVGV